MSFSQWIVAPQAGRPVQQRGPLGEAAQRRNDGGIQAIRLGPGQPVRHGLIGQRRQARVPGGHPGAQRVVEHTRVGALATPRVGRGLGSRRIARHGIEQRPGCAQQSPPPG